MSPARSPQFHEPGACLHPRPRQPTSPRGPHRLTVAFRPGSQARPIVGQTRCRRRLGPRDPDGRGCGEPQQTPRRERLASGPALTSAAAPRTPTGTGGRRAQSWSLRALAPHACPAPPTAGRDRDFGRVRFRLGGRRSAPPRLLGNVHASLSLPLSLSLAPPWLGRRPLHTFLPPTNQNS